MQILSSVIYMFVFIGVKIFSGESYSLLMLEISEMLKGSSNYLMWISAISAILSMIWCLILYRRSSWRVENFSYKEVFSKENIAGIFAAGVGGCVCLTVFLSVLMSVFPKAFESYNQLMTNFDSDTGVLTLVYVLFIGPISEEVIFRGAIFDRFYLAFSFWVANTLQAMLFGIYHMNIVQGIYAFLLGMLLGMIIYSTGSILCSIATHIIFNSTSYIVQILFGGDSAAMGVIFIIFLLLSVLMLVFSSKYYIIKCVGKCKTEKNIMMK